MKPVIIESPFRGENGDYEATSLYLDYCIRDCLSREETPYASHRMLPGALDDTVPVARQLGLDAGRNMSAWLMRRCDATVVIYTDLGVSEGMTGTLKWLEAEGFGDQYFERRNLLGRNFAAYQRELALLQPRAIEKRLSEAITEVANSGHSPKVYRVERWEASVETAFPPRADSIMRAEGWDRLDAIEALAKDLGADKCELSY